MILILYLTQIMQKIECSEDDISLTPLENPLFPILLGTSRLIYTKHTFIHYLDLGEVVRQVEVLENNFLIVRNHIPDINATNPISYQGLAENMLQRTEYLVKLLERKLENIHPHIRTRRGLIDGLGKVNKWLFGNLDSEDGVRYDNAIEILEQNQKQLIHETNLQMSLYKKLIDHYNKSLTTLWQNQQKLQFNLEKFQASIENEINNLDKYITFQGIISQINLDCQNMIEFIDNIENAIVFSKLNSIHNAIISSQEIQEMISYLKKNLQK
jgi:hypothetical protein